MNLSTEAWTVIVAAGVILMTLLLGARPAIRWLLQRVVSQYDSELKTVREHLTEITASVEVCRSVSERLTLISERVLANERRLREYYPREVLDVKMDAHLSKMQGVQENLGARINSIQSQLDRIERKINGDASHRQPR